MYNRCTCENSIIIRFLFEEFLVQALSTQGAAKDLRIDSVVPECLRQLLCNNLLVLIKTATLNHVDLELLGKDPRRSVRLLQ